MTAPAAPRPLLGLWDCISLIVGIVIGTVIFKMPPFIFQNAGGPWAGLGLWLAGGLAAFCGGLVFAELATTYPRSGGEYNYLTRAYGRWAGFAFGWAQLSVVQTGSIGFLSYVAGEYAADLFQLPKTSIPWIAAGVVLVITLLNMAGIRTGRRVQNALSISKLLGLSLLVIAGLGFGQAEWTAGAPAADAASRTDWATAFILILYAYGGWSDAAFVVAEMKDPGRNVPRAMFVGIAAVTIVYLLINLAYLQALGYTGLCASQVPPTDLLRLIAGNSAGNVMSVLVLVSALGGVNGLVFAVSRVHAALGADHPLFAAFARRDAADRAPVWALAAQGAVTLGIILAVGTESGRRAVDRLLTPLHLGPIPWDRFFGGFDTLFAASAPVYWCFFLLTGVSYFILRWKDADLPRPFRTPYYPLIPLLFCGISLFGLHAAWNFGGVLWPLVLLPLAAGVPLFIISEVLRLRGSDPAVGPTGPRPASDL